MEVMVLKYNISQDAIIGVAGTLLGTVTGWLLGILSNRGSIKVSIKETQVLFTKNIDDPFTQFKESVYNDNPDGIKISTTLEIYNNYYKTSGIHDLSYELHTERNQHSLNFELSGVSEFTNIDPHKYVKQLIYNAYPCQIEEKVSSEIKNGFKVYLIYYINGKRFKKKKLVYKL